MTEEAGMAGGSAEHEAVLVLDFALDDAVAEGGVVFGGRDEVLP